MNLENPNYSQEQKQTTFQKIRKSRIAKTIGIFIGLLQILSPSLAYAKEKSQYNERQMIRWAEMWVSSNTHIGTNTLYPSFLLPQTFKEATNTVEAHKASSLLLPSETNTLAKEQEVPVLSAEVNPIESSKEEVITKKEVKAVTYKRSFISDIPSSVIGLESNTANDKVFKISIDRKIQSTEQVYLEYELYGVADAKSVVKSINDEPAIGGYLIEKKQEWTTQKELLSSQQLVQGTNYIKFNLPEDKEISYRIKNVRISTEKLKKSEPLYVQDQTAYKKGNKIYLSGIVSQPAVNSIEIQGKNYELRKGNFEVILEDTHQLKTISLRAGNFTKEIPVKEQIHAEYVKTEIEEYKQVQVQFKKEQKNKINFLSSTLLADSTATKKDVFISVTAIKERDMMPLPSEMINVTDSYSAYRYLPHGEHFSHPAEIAIAYDNKKIPQGYTPYDIQTFYFDNDQKKWLALSKDSLDIANQKVISKTTHFTDFINGIIQVPESPETGNYTPTTLSDIKAADPSAGVVSIAAPTPNQQGTVSTSFPIKLPAGRAGLQPSLEVSYSSEAGNGWMGLGWNLAIPGISIDSRWGVPKYDPAKETEIYVIGGEQLTFRNSEGNYVMPHREGGNDQNRVANRQFYPRIEGAYAKIERIGNSPTNYYWKITSKDGTQTYYGGDPAGNSIIRDNNSNITYWGLWKVVDPNKNYTEYLYDNLSYTGSPGRGGKEMYLREIQYTKHETQPTKSMYRVLFNSGRALIDNSLAQRKDVQISGRSGALEVTSRLLSGIEIKYNNEPIRSYQFTYTEGAFMKTLLSSISEYDAEGKLFYTHTMEYNNEVKKDNNYTLFTTPRSINTGNDGVNYFSVLGGGESKSKSYGGAVTVGIAKLFSKDMIPT